MLECLVRSPGRFNTALLEAVRPGTLEEELLGLDDALAHRGLRVQQVLLKNLARNRVPVTRQTFVAGRLDVIAHALRRLQVELPAPRDYPPAAAPWLGRHVWPSTLGAARSRVEERGETLFVKPRGTVKRFTGKVFTNPLDFRSLRVTSPSAAVWCSEVVEVVSEYRGFMLDGQVIDLRHYSGDPERQPLEGVVSAVVAALAAGLPAGCALDFAVLADGRTVFLELNDGYSLGRYGLKPELYLNLLMARWEQIIA